MPFSFTDAIGLLGVIIIVITYMLLQFERLSPKALSFSLLNALGAFLIIVSLLYDWNLSAFVIEFFWMLLSLYGIGKYYVSKKRMNK
ncbi:MAG: hypothetical protein JXK04_01785 [Campylobacterales bacterium]|nr:hypothetical protein [Campylobacterales bacterium]